MHIDKMNISALITTPSFIALGSDEGHQIQLFNILPNQVLEPLAAIALTHSTDELDIEGFAWQKPYLYAIGSHSLKRKKIKQKLTQQENLKRLPQVIKAPARYQLFRIKLSADLQATEIKKLSLSKWLKKHTVLNRFTAIPSKENGVDIEGLAISPNGQLLIGFRGPVLRGNLTPVLALKLSKKHFKVQSIKSYYLPLNGLGVRGMSEMPKGYLILAGATGAQSLPYQLFRWNGKNALAGSDIDFHAVKPLCSLPITSGKPEGIQFIKKSEQSIQFKLVNDGAKNGQLSQYQCRPN